MSVTREIGKIGFVPRGTWDSSLTYLNLDMVYYNEESYVAIKTSSNIVPTNVEYWMKLLSASGKTATNKNLLDNWYFIGGGSQKGPDFLPINRRNGKISIENNNEIENIPGYNMAGYTIDRWYNRSSHLQVSLQDDGIKILRISSESTEYPYFNQRIYHENLLGKDVTLSMVVNDINITSGTGKDIYVTIYASNSVSTDSQDLAKDLTKENGIIFDSESSPGLYQTTIHIPDNLTFEKDGSTTTYSGLTIGIRFNHASVNDYINIAAIKLEIGNIQTLVHIKNNSLVFNEIPDYDEELYKCKNTKADSSDYISGFPEQGAFLSPDTVNSQQIDSYENGINIKVCSYNMGYFSYGTRDNTSLRFIDNDHIIKFRQFLSKMQFDYFLAQEEIRYIDSRKIGTKTAQEYLFYPLLNGLYTGGLWSNVIHSRESGKAITQGTVAFSNSDGGNTARNLTYATFPLGNSIVLLLIDAHCIYDDLGSGYANGKNIQGRKENYEDIFLWANNYIKLRPWTSSDGIDQEEGHEVAAPYHTHTIVCMDANCYLDVDRENLINAANLQLDDEKLNELGITPKEEDKSILCNGGRFGWNLSHFDSIGGEPLDVIAVSNNILVKNFTAMIDDYKELYSDHVPVVAELVLKNAGVPLTHKNLLDNWYFMQDVHNGNKTFPINQREQSTYDTAGYTIDRWYNRPKVSQAEDGALTLTLKDKGIELKRNTSQTGTETFPYFYQRILQHENLLGKNVTLSVLINESYITGTNVYIGIYASNSVGNSPSVGNLGGITIRNQNSGLYQKTIHIPDNLTFGSTTYSGLNLVIGFYSANQDDYINIAAIKLEIGDTQTLANQIKRLKNDNYEDSWVINEAPNYEDELLKCQQYFICYGHYFTHGWTTDNSRYIMIVHTPTNMVNLPNATFSDYVIRKNGGYSSVTPAYNRPASPINVAVSSQSSNNNFYISDDRGALGEGDTNAMFTDYQVTNLQLSCEPQ